MNTATIASLFAYSAAMVGATWTAYGGRSPLLLTAWLAAAGAPYLVLLVRKVPPRFPSFAVAVLVAGILGALWVGVEPVLSDDVYRFVWEGRLWSHGYSPYQAPPSAASLASLRDATWEQINHRQLTSTYPPVAQTFFFVGGLSPDGVLGAKVVALLLHLGAVAMMATITSVRGTTAPLAIALNPLALSESALNGHFDIAVGTFLLAAGWALARGRPMRAAVHLVLAVGSKGVGVLLGPLVWRARWQAGLVAVVGSVAMLAPVLAGTPQTGLDGPAEFATRWRGNDLIFGWIESLFHVWMDPQQGSMVARGAVVAIVVVLACVLAWRRSPPLHAARMLVWTVLLLSPQVHPWYLLWLLPIEIAAGRLAAVLWTMVVWVAYLPVEGWLAAGVWRQPGWTVVVEYGVVFGALIWECARGWRAAREDQTR